MQVVPRVMPAAAVFVILSRFYLYVLISLLIFFLEKWFFSLHLLRIFAVLFII